MAHPTNGNIIHTIASFITARAPGKALQMPWQRSTPFIWLGSNLESRKLHLIVQRLPEGADHKSMVVSSSWQDPCPTCPIRGYSLAMNNLSKILPPDLESWIETRVAGGAYFDSADYLRQLVRKDRAEVEDTAWVRAKIEEGLASGVIDQDPTDVIEDIIAERRARRA